MPQGKLSLKFLSDSIASLGHSVTARLVALGDNLKRHGDAIVSEAKRVDRLAGRVDGVAEAEQQTFDRVKTIDDAVAKTQTQVGELWGKVSSIEHSIHLDQEAAADVSQKVDRHEGDLGEHHGRLKALEGIAIRHGGQIDAALAALETTKEDVRGLQNNMTLASASAVAHGDQIRALQAAQSKTEGELDTVRRNTERAHIVAARAEGRVAEYARKIDDNVGRFQEEVHARFTGIDKLNLPARLAAFETVVGRHSDEVREIWSALTDQSAKLSSFEEFNTRRIASELTALTIASLDLLEAIKPFEFDLKSPEGVRLFAMIQKVSTLTGYQSPFVDEMAKRVEDEPKPSPNPLDHVLNAIDVVADTIAPFWAHKKGRKS